jgi:hypothetical protein
LCASTGKREQGKTRAKGEVVPDGLDLAAQFARDHR